MKKKPIKTKLEKVSIWGQLSFTGHFLVTVSSVVAWLYSKDPKLANEFVRITSGLYRKIKKNQKKREKELKEKDRALKKIIEPDEKITEPEKKKKKRRFKFW